MTLLAYALAVDPILLGVEVDAATAEDIADAPIPAANVNTTSHRADVERSLAA